VVGQRRNTGTTRVTSSISAGSRPGRQSADEITLFKSVGLAVQDAVAAAGALRAAESLGLGTRVEL